jgi:hypothetical protein
MWYSLSQLVEISEQLATSGRYPKGLPGMPSNIIGIRRLSVKENWRSQPRSGRGGGKEYFSEDFPKETQAVLAKLDSKEDERIEEVSSQDHSQEIIAPITLNVGFEAPAPNTPQSQLRCDTKLSLLSAFDLFRTRENMRLSAARWEFVRRYNSNLINLPSWIRAVFPTVSQISLCRWEKFRQKHNFKAFAGNYGQKKGCAIEKNIDIKTAILGELYKNPDIKISYIYTYLKSAFSDVNFSLRSLQRWTKNWKQENKVTFLMRKDKDKYKGKYKGAVGSASEGIVRFNQRWELDSTPTDVEIAILNEFGLDSKRFTVLGLIDVFSRSLILHVAERDNSDAVIALIRKGITLWGVPEEVRTDNGRNYISNRVRRCVESLKPGMGIQWICNPGQPQEKPFIEAAMKKVNYGCMEFLPGYLGHSVAERKRISARNNDDELLNLTEFQQFLDAFCNDYNEIRSHRGLTGEFKGMTPGAVKRLGELRNPAYKIENERILDLLLAEVPSGNGKRRVRKKGLEIDGGWFIDERCELLNHIDDDVWCYWDPFEMDLGKVYVYSRSLDDPNAEFIGIAICPERVGRSRVDLIDAQKQIERKRSEALKVFKGAARVSRKDVVKALVDGSDDALEKLATLPVASLTLDDELPAVSDAANCIEISSPVVSSSNDEPKEEGRVFLHNENSVPGRYERLWYRKFDGEDLTFEDLDFMTRFESSGFMGRSLSQSLQKAA